MHLRIKGIGGDREGRLITKIEPIGEPLGGPIVNMGSESMACRRAAREDIRVTAPVGQPKDAWECWGTLKAFVDRL